MTEEKLKIIPKCKGGNQSYFSASGRWLPCCSFPDEGKTLEQSIFARDDFLIEKSNTLEFHELDIFHLWLDKIEDDYDSAYSICKHRCSKDAHEKQKNTKDMTWVMEEHYLIANKFDLFDFLERHDIEYEWE
jgi:ssDNA-binding Zn-finger/Zn-ribbon topoisomerase 1